jgi:hypothetical protein
MANRLIRNTVILLKPEVTYALDPTPTGAANAMLVSNLSINPFNATTVDRDLIRSYLGASEALIGSKYVEMGFDVELTGSGTVAVAPAWGNSLLACGMAETVTATFRVDYTPVSASFGSCTIYWYDDGLLHKATGVRGAPVFKLGINNRPVMSYKFLGLYSTPTVVANPSTTLTAWKTPQLISEANTLDLTFGGTHATGVAPVIASGTTYPSQGIEMDLGNKVDFNPLLGGETVDLTSRATTAKVTLDLTATQEAAMIASAEAGTLQTVGLSHGTVANQKVLIWLPSVQITNVQKAEANGKRLVALDLRCLPSSSGNDEVRIVTSF